MSEELFGLHGFSGTYVVCCTPQVAECVIGIEAVDFAEPSSSPPINRCGHDHLVNIEGGAHGDDSVLGPLSYLFGNDDVRVAWVVAVGEGPLYRNTAGDELVYVQSGSASCESVFGHLDAHAGDYVLVPAGTTHRWHADTSCEMLVIERGGHVNIPTRYRSGSGQMLEGRAVQ